MRTAALLLVPLALFAGSAFAVDLMSCRGQGVVSSGCCCPPPAMQSQGDEHPRLEQGCCESFTLSYSSEAPAPQAQLAFAPLSRPLWLNRPFHDSETTEATRDNAPRAERTPDATGPPLRVLHCSYLT